MKIKEIEWTKDGINIKVGDRNSNSLVIGKVNGHTFDIDDSMGCDWLSLAFIRALNN